MKYKHYGLHSIRIFIIALTFSLTGCISTNGLTNNNPAATINAELALLYLKNKELDYAKEKLAKAYSLGKDNPKVFLAFAKYNEYISNSSEAIIFYERAIAVSKNPFNLKLDYAKFLCKHNHLERAKRLYHNLLNKPNIIIPIQLYKDASICFEICGDAKLSTLYKDRFRKVSASLVKNPTN